VDQRTNQELGKTLQHLLGNHLHTYKQNFDNPEAIAFRTRSSQRHVNCISAIDAGCENSLSPRDSTSREKTLGAIQKKRQFWDRSAFSSH
jgi:hypothetical protein